MLFLDINCQIACQDRIAYNFARGYAMVLANYGQSRDLCDVLSPPYFCIANQILFVVDYCPWSLVNRIELASVWENARYKSYYY